MCARLADSRERNTPCRAETDDHVFGVIEEVFLVADFVGLHFLPAFEHAQVGFFFVERVEVNGSEEAAFTVHCAVGRPIEILAFDFHHLGHLGGFHHLTD